MDIRGRRRTFVTRAPFTGPKNKTVGRAKSSRQRPRIPFRFADIGPAGDANTAQN